TRFSRDWSSDVCSSDLSAITLEGTMRLPALSTGGGVVGTVAFNNVIFHQRAAGPAVQRQVGVLGIVDIVAAGVTDGTRSTWIPEIGRATGRGREEVRVA